MDIPGGGGWDLAPRWLPLAVFILALVVGIVIGLGGAVVLWATIEHREAREEIKELREDLKTEAVWRENTRERVQKLELTIGGETDGRSTEREDHP